MGPGYDAPFRGFDETLLASTLFRCKKLTVCYVDAVGRSLIENLKKK